jgi:transposase
VALVARQHGVNANQVFQWRRLYAQGLLNDEDPPRVMPVRITERTSKEGRIELEFAEVRLSIEGAPDPATLRMILDKVLG